MTVGSKILHSEEPHNLYALREMMRDKGVEGVIPFEKWCRLDYSGSLLHLFYLSPMCTYFVLLYFAYTVMTTEIVSVLHFCVLFEQFGLHTESFRPVFPKLWTPIIE